jgi:type II secretory pathway component PulJ
MEVVVTSALLMLVVASMLTLFNGVQKTAAREQSRSETNDQLRLAMERLAKDIRQADAVRAGSTTSTIDLDTFASGVPTRVTWAVSGATLTRAVDGGTPITIVERVQQAEAFTYTPTITDPTVVTITLVAKPLKFSADPVTVTLTSEVTLRNR